MVLKLHKESSPETEIIMSLYHPVYLLLKGVEERKKKNIRF